MCCVGSGLCDELITCSGESYWFCVRVSQMVHDLETSTLRRSRPYLVCSAIGGKMLKVEIKIFLKICYVGRQIVSILKVFR